MMQREVRRRSEFVLGDQQGFGSVDNCRPRLSLIGGFGSVDSFSVYNLCFDRERIDNPRW